MNSLRKAVGLAIVMSVAIVGQALAAQTDVSLVNVAGSRTMTAKTLAGDDLTALSMGSNREAPFLINVTDVAYDRQDYQVTAQLSNLYRYDPVSDTWFCSDVIPSSSLSVGFLDNPVSVRDVAAIAQPVLDFTASLTAELTTLLGLPAGTSILASTTEELQSFATSTVFSGVEAALPLKVATGAGGAFAERMPHASCSDGGASLPTAVEVQDGSISNDPTMFDWVQDVSDAIFATADSNADSVLSAAEAETGGLVSPSAVEDAIRDALINDLGVNPLLVTDLVIADVKVLLTSVNDTIADILGQTGSYSSLPKLVVNVPDGTPTGLFKGTMTITLIDPVT